MIEKKEEKIDWEKRVKESQGRSLFMPDSLLEKTKEWSKDRQEFTKQLEQVAKHEIELNNSFNEIMLAFRKHCEEIGMEIWQKEIGFDGMAMKEGIFIVNINDPMK